MLVNAVSESGICNFDSAQTPTGTRIGKIEAMKAFLGVLGDDLMHRDLADIDPRRLAEGRHEETTSVAQLLCALASEMDLKRDNNLSISVASSVAGSSTMAYSRATDVWTVPNTVQSRTPESSFLFSSSSSDRGDGSTIVFDGGGQQPKPSEVRYDGWIEPVQGDLEAFESSRFVADVPDLRMVRPIIDVSPFALVLTCA